MSVDSRGYGVVVSEIFFIRAEDDTWSHSGRFRIKDALDGVRAQQKLLVFTE
jgi:hypothetical protein